MWTIVTTRLFSSLSVISLTFITCGCDAERVFGALSGDAQCPCAFGGGISYRQEGSDEEERKQRQQIYIAGYHSFTAGVLFSASHLQKNALLLLIYFSSQSKSLQYVSDLTSLKATRNIRLPWWMWTLTLWTWKR